MGHVQIVITCKKIDWGLRDSSKACAIGFIVEFGRGGKQFQHVDLHIEAQKQSKDKSKRKEPVIAVQHSPDERYGKSSDAEISYGASLDPQAQSSVGGGRIFSVDTSKKFERATFWQMSSRARVRGVNVVGATWSFDGNETCIGGFPPWMRIGLIVTHTDEPFNLLFTASGTTMANNMGRIDRLIGRAGHEKEIRTFNPDVNAVSQIESKLLDDWVDEYTSAFPN